jgi:hypothetical protein
MRQASAVAMIPLCVCLVAGIARASKQSPSPGGITRSVIVLSVRSSTQSQRCSNSTLNAEVFTAPDSVRAYFNENSYGLASISGEVSGPYTIAVGDTCDLVGWADQVDAAASAAGLNVSTYDSKIYVLPPESTSLKCTPGRNARSRIWIRQDTCESKFNIAHELGHAFGANHSGIAASYAVPPVPSQTQTVERQFEYGDLSSVMGGILDGLVDPKTERAMFNTTPHFSAPQKIDVGWLPAANIQSVTLAGSYKVGLLENARNEIQVLKVITMDTIYYCSYRRAVGFDSPLLTQYVDKTSVHTTRTRLSTRHANLADGQSFTDAHVSITQQRHDATYAYLTIAFR